MRLHVSCSDNSAPYTVIGCCCVFTNAIWNYFSKNCKYKIWTTMQQFHEIWKFRNFTTNIRPKQKQSKKIFLFVRCGVRTHAHFREPELKSGALDRSANLTSMNERAEKANFETRLWRNLRFRHFFRFA